MRPIHFVFLTTLCSGLALAAGALVPAVVHKASVNVHAKPDFGSPNVATLSQNQQVQIAGQEGLWFKLNMPGGAAGYVRINDVRMAYSGKDDGSALQVLTKGKAGKGRVSETAGVRGIDESDLRSASFDSAQLAKLDSYRVTPGTAEANARTQGWARTPVAYATEAQPAGPTTGKASSSAKGKSSGGSGWGGLGRGLLGGVLGAVGKVIPKSEAELSDEEVALGPEIAGRVLGAAPLWKDDPAQRRINLIGRWIASQTSRPELPWTFGVIDTPEVNAFAAPGGYVLLTRGLYQLLGSDAELAGVLGHEISHIVQRDHYTVIRKQAMSGLGREIASSQVNIGGGIAGGFAKSYAEKHGAAIMSTSLDREAEYRADEAGQIYLARAGFNPLALYAVLQKMTAFGSQSSRLSQLYKTHPPTTDRLDRIDQRGYGALETYTRR
ncbi:MAG TPA: M48 family metalloprotease [Xanthomonadaceae bacterium]|nr:M48 family metalloprotease [Xanthomonadaceae bacterium]